MLALLQEVTSILLKLKTEVVATEELIRVRGLRCAHDQDLAEVMVHPKSTQETKIGVTVNKLRQNADKAVSDLAKEIVRKWKADVGPAASSKAKGSQSPSGLSFPLPHVGPGSVC